MAARVLYDGKSSLLKFVGVKEVLDVPHALGFCLTV